MAKHPVVRMFPNKEKWASIVAEARKEDDQRQAAKHAEVMLASAGVCPACNCEWEYCWTLGDLTALTSTSMFYCEDPTDDGAATKHGYCPFKGCRLWDLPVVV